MSRSKVKKVLFLRNPLCVKILEIGLLLHLKVTDIRAERQLMVPKDLPTAGKKKVRVHAQNATVWRWGLGTRL